LANDLLHHGRQRIAHDVFIKLTVLLLEQTATFSSVKKKKKQQHLFFLTKCSWLQQRASATQLELQTESPMVWSEATKGKKSAAGTKRCFEETLLAALPPMQTI
jgi:hypothetical protein